jgi:predicted ferric reductase
MRGDGEQQGMTALDLSADIGLLGVFLATANICLGLLIAVRYSPSRLWPHRRVNIFAVHTWTAYFLMTSLLVHPIILLFSRKIRWRLLDLVVPIWSPVQPIQNTIGAVSLYLIVVVVATSYFRVRLGRHRWKLFHYLVYVAGVGTFIHGILADPNLKGNAIDLLDGEKLFIESCLLVVVLATVWAWRYRLRKDREERTAGTGRYRVPESAKVST